MRSRVGFRRKSAAIAVLPLRTAEAVMGTFNVGSSRVDWISADQQVFLEGAATRLAAALQNALVLEELHSSCERLQKECDLQKSALKKSHDELELEVARRTAEIQKLQERLRAENIQLKEDLAGVHAYGGIIGKAPLSRQSSPVSGWWPRPMPTC